MKKSGIHIKESHKGLLTKKLGGKITEAKLEKAEKSKSAATRKQAVFAENARKWNHKGNKKK